MNSSINNLEDLTWDAIIPIGDACASTLVLKTAGLRRVAFPFDWVISFPKMTLKDLQENFQLLLNKDKKQYSHYQKFEKEEINKIFQNRIDRFNRYLNSNLNIIFFYSNWARISSNTLKLIKTEDEGYLLEMIQFFKEKNLKNVQYIFTNINNSFENLKKEENVKLIDINLNLSIETTDLNKLEDRHNFTKEIESFFKNSIVEELLKMNLKFNNLKEEEKEDLNQNISTEWW